MEQQNALKLLEISANLASSAMQAKNTSMNESEVKSLFLDCVNIVNEQFKTFANVENIDEKFATISEMHKIFAQKFAEIEQHKSTDIDEKFNTIGEMHQVFAQKFAEVEKRLNTLSYGRTTRRPV
ncbi:MAG: hypothetical protein KAH84_05890 [Thiomargarita sp.]|nr:hypothetical protein [Thiomargarita sp.]